MGRGAGIGLSLWVAASGPETAAAQSTPQPTTPPSSPSTSKPAAPAKPAPKAEPATVEAVTVTGATSGTRTSIDRRSYDLTQDLVGSGGSVADALRNVPTLSVDLQGNVSIRGDANVKVLVDGKPSTLFSGGSIGQVLDSLPADQFERVEVITNPTAALSPDGSAGVINLISKKARKPGVSGSARVSADALGRFNTGFTLNRKAERLTVSVNASVRHQTRGTRSSDERETFAASGATTSFSQGRTRSEGGSDSAFGRLGFDYDVDRRLRLSGSLRFGRFSNEQESFSERIRTNPAGVTDSSIERRGLSDWSRSDVGAELTLRRTYEGENHDLVVSLSRNRTGGERGSHATTVNLIPPGPDTYDRGDSSDEERLTELKADYQKPLTGGGRLKLGYAGVFEDEAYATRGFVAAPSPATPFNPLQNNRFEFRRGVQAVYGTLERPIGKVTLLGGLRWETTAIEIDQRTQGVFIEREESRLFPSAHVAWTPSDDHQLVASYGQRVQRPGAQELDPFVTIAGPFDRYAGNPNLLPQLTYVYELRWDYRPGQGTYSVNLFYKDRTGGVAQVATDLGGGVVLTTNANLATSRDTGFDLQASGKLFRVLSYNLGGTVARVEIDPTPLSGVSRTRAGTTVQGNANLNWQVTPNDLLQLNGWAGGSRISAQGESAGFAVLNLGYRHKFSDKLSVVVTAQDVLGSSGGEFRIDTVRLSQHSRFRSDNRSLFVGLVYSFGKGPKREPGFDYGSGG
jgi:outer membrane receptor protein involved in Fe transport